QAHQPQARQGTPVGAIQSRRRLLGVLRCGHEQSAKIASAVSIPRWPRGPGENHRRTEKRLCFRIDPTQTYSANTAWQKLHILAHNLMTTFQLLTTATKKPRTAKRTGLFLLRSVTTLRFEWLNRAARWLRPGGTPTPALGEQ